MRSHDQDAGARQRFRTAASSLGAQSPPPQSPHASKEPSTLSSANISLSRSGSSSSSIGTSSCAASAATIAGASALVLPVRVPQARAGFRGGEALAVADFDAARVSAFGTPLVALGHDVAAFAYQVRSKGTDVKCRKQIANVSGHMS